MSSLGDLWHKLYSPMIFALSLRNLKLNKFRTALSMIGIIIGVFAICGLGMVGAAFTENINDMVAENANTLMISSIEEKNIDGRVVNGFSDKDISEIEGSVKTVTTDYEIITANMGTKYVMAGKDGVYAFIIAIDPEGLQSLMGSELEEGTMPKGPGGVVIMKEYADNHNLHINSRLSTTDAYGNEVNLRITGILKESQMMSMMSGSQEICMLAGTLDLYKNLLGTHDGLYDYVIVKVDDPLLLNPLEDAVERTMNGKSYKDSDNTVQITNSYDTLDSLNDVLSLTSLFTAVISGISLLVASVAIVNVMMMSVKERTREIGILRSIGTRRNQIMQMFIYEAGIIGLVGAFIGVVFACVAVPFLLIIMMDTAEYMLTLPVLAYVPIGILIGLVVCLIAGLYPALKAAHLNPVEAMATD